MGGKPPENPPTCGPAFQPFQTKVPSSASFQGRFQGLDLNEELYLGGYPNYAAIAKTGLGSGFVGEMQGGGVSV